MLTKNTTPHYNSMRSFKGSGILHENSNKDSGSEEDESQVDFEPDKIKAEKE